MLRVLAQVAADAHFYHRLTTFGQHAASWRVLLTAFRSRGLWLLTAHRIGYFTTTRRNLGSLKWWLARVLEMPAYYLAKIRCKSEMLGDCELEGPVYLPDGGYLMCGAERVGAGSLIHNHVTIGFGVADGNVQRPRIGREVWIGPGCIIAGDLEVGDGATLLPGTYLTYSVPPRSVIRGNPGRIIQRGYDNTRLRQSREVVYALPDADDS